ncbi:hypothetical protein COLO4_22930 [Corchorus olitorius]|uniref:Uncharacterized protein n=1 Tax=Corchorus olitorius TaxID=93759 RepID=A0A1R3IJ50_9ROSI|nr:hypothetical protein COLO4_22930 [Corchorus olitorius]
MTSMMTYLSSHFYMVGGIEEVIAKADKIAKESAA